MTCVRSAELQPSALQIARAVTAYGLHGSRDELPAVPLSQDRWRQVFDLVCRHRTSGFLTQAISDGRFAATPVQADEAHQEHRASVIHCLLLERALLDVVALLDANGIDHRLLKGSALAHLSYPDPALRLFVDIDLLVRPSQFDEAVRLLVDTGYDRTIPELRPGFERRFAKATALVGPDGTHLDLHRTLARGRFGLTIPLDDLFEGSASVEIANSAVPVLGLHQRFLHACYHAVLTEPERRMVALRDVAQMLLSGGVDHDKARALAQAWNGEAAVARALCLTWQVLGLRGGSPLLDWARAFRPGWLDRRALEAFTTTSQILTSLPSIKGAPAKLAFLRGVIAPGPEFLRARGQAGYRSWWRRGLDEGRHGVGK